jgi:hypothetical protein
MIQIIIYLGTARSILIIIEAIPIGRSLRVTQLISRQLPDRASRSLIIGSFPLADELSDDATWQHHLLSIP